MWIIIASGFLVSIDALFIGISLGAQKKCRFWHVALIFSFLALLCFLGYALGKWIGERADIELDFIIGSLFIALGLWTIIHYFAFERRHNKKKELTRIKCEAAGRENCNIEILVKSNKPSKNSIFTGVFASVEALAITVGLTLLIDNPTILLPITVAVAHFAYATLTFFLSKYLRRLPQFVGPLVAGTALIIYGILAFVL